MSGVLILVATPIGNLGDVSQRAIETLAKADVIACEDTRHTRKLLNHAGIKDVRVMALHEHNEMQASEKVVDLISNGDTVALVSDAGMPAISDPGQRVVAAVAAARLRVSVVPGPSASLAALAVSGLPTARFCFEGFLPRKGVERRARLEALAVEQRTSVLFEAPQRVSATINDLIKVCAPDRLIALVRELTKVHEEVLRMTLAQLSEHLGDRELKGECVLVLDGAAAPTPVSDAELIEALRSEIEAGATKKSAVVTVSDQFGAPKNHVYELASALR